MGDTVRVTVIAAGLIVGTAPRPQTSALGSDAQTSSVKKKLCKKKCTVT